MTYYFWLGAEAETVIPEPDDEWIFVRDLPVLEDDGE